ncbi:protein MAATS1 [Kipferlia bialata]|uniref:Cilia- and flagella-associated protein 91 n=1 Tax=Kipferlia bialata TaxID=797122 RepID=A0A9K3GF30_9EUKA|nr:protein MAATS1 [Kipferlia bialata]|eukprot:g1208.t1
MEAPRQAQHVQTRMHDLFEVSGRHRAKFFSRPVVPSLNALPPQVLLAPVDPNDPAVNPLVPPPLARERPGFVTRGVQTMYRESGTQTEVWTPPVAVPEGEEPEALGLVQLTYASGLLPANERTVEIIKRYVQMQLVSPRYSEEYGVFHGV